MVILGEPGESYQYILGRILKLWTNIIQDLFSAASS